MILSSGDTQWDPESLGTRTVQFYLLYTTQSTPGEDLGLWMACIVIGTLGFFGSFAVDRTYSLLY